MFCCCFLLLLFMWHDHERANPTKLLEYGFIYLNTEKCMYECDLAVIAMWRWNTNSVAISLLIPDSHYNSTKVYNRMSRKYIQLYSNTFLGHIMLHVVDQIDLCFRCTTVSLNWLGLRCLVDSIRKGSIYCRKISIK